MASLLTDWQFWTAVIALLALVLSQFPPIHTWIRPAKIDLDIYPRIWISHFIGNPSLQLQMIIRNIGGRQLRIQKMSAKIFRDNKEIANLPAQTYIPNPKDNTNVLLTKFYIKPNEEWSYGTTFLHYFDRIEESDFRKAELALRNEISNLISKKEHDDINPVYADETFVKPFTDLFDKKFIWTAGGYTIEINIETDNPKINLLKKHRFTIFESQSDILKESTKEYPTGAGIYLNQSNVTGTWINFDEDL